MSHILPRPCRGTGGFRRNVDKVIDGKRLQSALTLLLLIVIIFLVAIADDGDDNPFDDTPDQSPRVVRVDMY